MRIQIRLPYPPKELSPNSRVHWRTKAKHTAEYREACGWAAKEAMQKTSGVFPIAPPVAAYTIYYEHDRRRRDPDNHAAMLKAAWDGFKDAGLLVDDSADKLTIAPPVFYLTGRSDQRRVLVTLSDAPRQP